MVLAQVYRGRSFSLPGIELNPHEMFSRYGGLSLVVASAAQTFRILYPTGVPLERCTDCGAGRLPPPGTCPPNCPLASGGKQLDWPFWLEIVPADDAQDYLLPVRPRIKPSRPAIIMAHFHLVDAMQELIRMGDQPRLIDCAPMIDAVVHASQGLLQASPEPSMQAQPDPRMSTHVR